MRQWLTHIRTTKRCSQQNVAEACGISQQMYSAIEQGERRPSPETAKKIAEALNFDWTQFYQDKKPAREESPGVGPGGK